MAEPTEVLHIHWQGIAITVSIKKNWLNTEHHHIELRAEQPLPMTKTGYRSHFMPAASFHSFESLEQMVRLWLDETAKSKEWIKAEEDRKQLKLF